MWRDIAILGVEQKAHYLLHEPKCPDEDDAVVYPRPAILYLHGAANYHWPETLMVSIDTLIRINPVSRACWVIAPFGTCGEPLAIESQKRRDKKDRYGNPVKYVEDFHDDNVWSTFKGACEALGPTQVDFQRLCVVGASMGSQATWNLAAQRGAHLAAVAPMAGRCSWKGGWSEKDVFLRELSRLPIRQYAHSEDTNAYAWKDFRWIAHERGLESCPNETVVELDKDKELHMHSWNDSLQLFLLHGKGDCHNVWDEVFKNEEVFALFSWMVDQRCDRPLTQLAFTEPRFQ